MDMTIHMNRFAHIAGWAPGELELFAELWPIISTKEKSPAGTEDVVKQTHPILSQSETEAYADPNQICLEV